MALGFGLLSAQLGPGETDWRRVYRDTVALAVEAERLGLSSVWTTEHHFVDDGYMPSLLVTCAALATATTTLEIGTGVVLAPLYHPLRLAEDAATVSLLSDGRLTLGLGLGWSTIEYEAFGVDVPRRGKAMEETLAILRQAWSGRPVRHHGSVYDLPEVTVRPVPASSPPVLIGGGAEPAIRRAARAADGIFSNAPPRAFLRQLDWIRAECEQIGRDPDELRIVHYSVMLPADSEEIAWDTYRDHIWHMMWKYTDMEASAGRSGPPPEPPGYADEDRDSLLSRSTMLGTSDEIVSRLLELRQAAGCHVEFVARSWFSTLDQMHQVELMQRLAEEVSPHV
jgi:probable F420-dependent oxidoreductase